LSGAAAASALRAPARRSPTGGDPPPARSSQIRALGARLGCYHKTVKRYVEVAGELGQLAPAAGGRAGKQPWLGSAYSSASTAGGSEISRDAPGGQAATAPAHRARRGVPGSGGTRRSTASARLDDRLRPRRGASGRFAIPTNGRVAGCGSCAGSSASSTRHPGGTCGRWGIGGERPARGATQGRATAGRRLLSAPSRPRPIPTGGEQGLAGFTDRCRRLRDAERTAWCGRACQVVWEGPG
jgi:hypothetical protein